MAHSQTVATKRPAGTAGSGVRHYSNLVVDAIKQAPARAMLRAVGFTAARSAAECSGATSCPCSRRSVAGLSVKISDADLLEVERAAIPGAGSYGG
jgi:hypothetical protein